MKKWSKLSSPLWNYLPLDISFWRTTFLSILLKDWITLALFQHFKGTHMKGAVALCLFGYETFARRLIPWGQYTEGSKKYQPLVYMWSKPTPSFSKIRALLLKIWAFFWAPFSLFVVRFCYLWQKSLNNPDTFLPISQDSLNILQNFKNGIIIITRYLCCSEVSATSNKIRPQKMEMALRKMFISSKVMHQYCWNLV